MSTELDINALDLQEAAQYVLEGFPAMRTPPPPGADDTIAAQIELLGDEPAVMILSASAPAAAALAVAFFGADATDLAPSDLNDALTELANVLGGAIKPLFGVMTTLSIPTLIDGNGGSTSGAEVNWKASAIVDYGGGTISLKLRQLN